MASGKDPDEQGAAEAGGEVSPLAETAASPTAAALAATATSDGGAANTAADGLARGAAVGKYTVLSLLGEGGMGVVYAAYDPDLDRKVALKLLRWRGGDAARSRLLREAQAMARLTHPNVITVYEVGTVDDRDFIAMEFIDGDTLEGWVASEERSTGEIVEAFVQAGRGLAAAHAAGLVHRDFKPSNALVGGDGRVRVTDFGLARRVGEDGEGGAPAGPAASVSATLTRTGALMGTPAYMAPEQHEGKAADERSDQFGFAVALYEALYGQRPFGGDGFAELRARVLAGEIEAAPDDADVPAELRRAIVRALARDPGDRYPSMEEFLAALERRPRSPRRLWALVASIAVVIAAVIAAAAGTGGRTAGALCAAGAGELAGVWDDEARGRVRTAFAVSQVGGALEAFSRLAGVLDGYADEWVASYEDACEDTRVRGDVSEEDLVLRMKCLQERRRALDGLVSALEQVDPRGVDRAVEAAHDLPAVAACDDVAALRQGVAPPAPPIRTQVSALRAKLEAARALGDIGRTDDAMVAAEEVRDEARELGYAPLRAEVLNALGELYWREGRVRDSEAAYAEAEIAAEEAGYDAARAEALVGVTRLLATSSSRFEEAGRYGRRAQAALERLPAPESELEVELDLALARIAASQERTEEALAILDEASRSFSLRPLGAAKVAVAIGQLHQELADFGAARSAYERAVAIAERELGPDHPETIQYLAHLAFAHRLLGNYDRADAIDLRTRAFIDSERGQEILEQRVRIVPPASREVKGVVVDGRGEPVAGALVALGISIEGDARRIDPLWSAGMERQLALQRLTTDDKGRFFATGAPDAEFGIVAEHPELGRSKHQVIRAGVEIGPVRLVLEETGRFEGVVTSGGEPVAGAYVWILATRGQSEERLGNQPYAFGAFVTTRADGSFSFERLAPDRYVVMAGRGMARVASMDSTEIVVRSGETTRRDLTLSGGDGGLAVRVRGQGGVVIPSSQILVMPGIVSAETGAELNEMVLGGLAVRSSFGSAGETIEFRGLPPGPHSVCVVPLGGDFRDPEYVRALRERDVRALPVYCQPAEAVSGEMREVLATVPALEPLPASGKAAAQPGDDALGGDEAAKRDP